MNYQKSHRLLLLGLCAGAVMAFFGLAIGTRAGTVIGAVGVLLMIGGIAQAVVFYKCPDCGRQFDVRTRRPDYCPGCGKKLDCD